MRLQMSSIAINALQVRGEAAPKSNGVVISTASHIKAIRQATKNGTDTVPGYQFVFNKQVVNDDLTVTGLSGPTVPVRKMAHLSRIRTANLGMSTMDSYGPVSNETEPELLTEKPHFVLCGLPVGAKEIDHHLYVNETRVGNFKTSAKALYQARRGPRSGKAFSEPLTRSSEKHVINEQTNLPDVDEGLTQRTIPIPPIPPTTTPVNYAHYVAMMKPKTGVGKWSDQFHGSIPSVEAESSYLSSDLLVKHKKLTLLNREKSNECIDLQREHSSVSTRSMLSMETVSESVVNNSLTVTSGKGARLTKSYAGKAPIKVNYNNPYRNTKYKERMSLNDNKRMEFNSLDKYFKYQKQHQSNGKHFMTPRAILRIPKPCSDTFLLQMMYDLNRPISRYAGSGKYSDINRTHDLEEFVQSRTSSSLSKAQSNIDKYMNKPRSGNKSIKSVKSAKSVATEKIEEEEAIPEDDMEGIDENKL